MESSPDDMEAIRSKKRADEAAEGPHDPKRRAYRKFSEDVDESSTVSNASDDPDEAAVDDTGGKKLHTKAKEKDASAKGSDEVKTEKSKVADSVDEAEETSSNSETDEVDVNKADANEPGEEIEEGTLDEAGTGKSSVGDTVDTAEQMPSDEADVKEADAYEPGEETKKGSSTTNIAPKTEANKKLSMESRMEAAAQQASPHKQQVSGDKGREMSVAADNLDGGGSRIGSPSGGPSRLSETKG